MDSLLLLKSWGRGFDPRVGLVLIRYGVVGNMSGSHPVASGSIPGIGFLWLASLAQLVERKTSNLEVAGSTPARGLGFRLVYPQAVRSKLIIATILKRCSSGEEWWAHILFLCFGRGSKVVKCVWLRPKSLGFAGSTPALFCYL